jgi:hypothetical protein
MDSNTSKRNKITLPTIGAELFTYLKDVNDHESFTASRRLKDLLSDRVKVEINSWFKAAPLPELDRTLLRKITNSLLSAGSTGQKRTRDALSEIRFDEKTMVEPKSSFEATEFLRNWARDYRSAKGFLDYQYKCVNSFLRVQKTTNDESVRSLLKSDISSVADFKMWQHDLESYWNQKGLVKENLRTAYQNMFGVFMATFDDQLQNGMYHKYLDQNWQRYVDPAGDAADFDFDFDIETEEDSESFPEASRKSITNPFEVDLRIEGGEIFYHVVCNTFTEFQASELRFKIALSISQNKSFGDSRFSVALLPGDRPIILIRTDSPKDEASIRNVVTFLEQVLDESKRPK